MLDIRLVREKTSAVIEALKTRGVDASILDKLLRVESERRSHLGIVENLRQRRNELSEEIGQLKKQGKDASGLLEYAKKISDEIAEKEQHMRGLENQAVHELLLIPNIPHE